MDLLVIGGSGLLGLGITRRAQLADHSVVATFHARVPPTAGADWRKLDIRRRDDVKARSAADGALFADEVRCPVHAADLASALLEPTPALS